MLYITLLSLKRVIIHLTCFFLDVAWDLPENCVLCDLSPQIRIPLWLWFICYRISANLKMPSQAFMTKLYRVGRQSAWHDWGFRVEETQDFRSQRERLINKKASETVAMKLLLWEKELPGFLLLLLMLFGWWHLIKKCTNCAGKGSDAFAFSTGPSFLSAGCPGLDWLDGK